MADTNTATCLKCGHDTDCIEGLCQECYLICNASTPALEAVIQNFEDYPKHCATPETIKLIKEEIQNRNK